MLPIDLRSDTVTRPSAGMRAAMAAADVGDDVYGEDPTVNALQARVATLVGKPAALFVPSGSMANQTCIKAHTSPGDDVLCGDGAHVMLYESGAAGALSGVQLTVVGQGGLFDAEGCEAAFKPDNHHHAPTRLVCLENTHNRGGGRVWPRAQLAGVVEWARRRGLRLHLDGARLWNAHVATGVPLAELAAPFDSVSVCLSKGLGAPVGSLLCGDVAFVHRAHRIRKMLGGGMRQAGVLAAAGLFALDHNLARLGDDHARAKLLAERLSAAGAGLPYGAETNIVIFDLSGPAAPFVEASRAAGVLVNAVGPSRVRAVTHLDVDRDAVTRAAEVLAGLLPR